MKSESTSTALATVATVCWCVQLIPQIIYNWRRKDCTGLPPIMLFLWVASGIPFGIYFIISRGNITLQIQPHLFMFFCAISFIQTCYYPPVSMKRKKIVLIIAAIIAADVGLELGFILWLRPLYDRGITWPALVFGVIATILLAVGLLPPYFELAKRKGRVVGINFLFLFIDSAGAWLSIGSVIVGNMDVMGIILYSVVAALELGICVSHLIWWSRCKWFDLNFEEELENVEGTGEFDEEHSMIQIEETISRNKNMNVHYNMENPSMYNPNDYGKFDKKGGDTKITYEDIATIVDTESGEVFDRVNTSERASKLIRSIHGISVEKD